MVLWPHTLVPKDTQCPDALHTWSSVPRADPATSEWPLTVLAPPGNDYSESEGSEKKNDFQNNIKLLGLFLHTPSLISTQTSEIFKGQSKHLGTLETPFHLPKQSLSLTWERKRWRAWDVASGNSAMLASAASWIIWLISFWEIILLLWYLTNLNKGKNRDIKYWKTHRVQQWLITCKDLFCAPLLQHLNHRPDFYTTSNGTSANIYVDGALIYSQTYLGLSWKGTKINEVTFWNWNKNSKYS